MLKNNRKLKKILIPAEPEKPALKTPVPVKAAPAPTPVAVSAPKPAPGPAPTPAANRVSLTLVKPGATSVFVAGSFNEWQPERTPLCPVGDGRWVGSLAVAPGRYEYLFVVDGEWLPDPNAKETTANPFGGQNSVLVAAE